MSLVASARAIATQAHVGQTDKTGHPYITHPERVAARTRAAGGTDKAIAVAWLHDVLEDTPTAASDLRRAGMPDDVISAVEALSKRPHETPEAYFQRVNADPLAIRVKHADLDDNTDPARTAALEPGTRQRLATKYARARRLLAPVG